MEYLKIGETDFSNYVRQLTVSNTVNYAAQTNAAGNTVVDFINNKRTITVGIIPVNSEVMLDLLSAIGDFSVNLSFRNPNTNIIEENVLCIIPTKEIDYYTIQQNKVMYNELELQFIEL